MNTDEKSIEELEGQAWPKPEFSSYVVTESHRIRKIKIRNLTIEQLRLAFSQGEGTVFLKNRVMEELRIDPLVSGDFYDGDLLLSVMRSELIGFEKKEIDELLEIADLAISREEDEEAKEELTKMKLKVKEVEPVVPYNSSQSLRD